MRSELLTPGLVAQIQGRALIGAAADIAHGCAGSETAPVLDDEAKIRQRGRKDWKKL